MFRFQSFVAVLLALSVTTAPVAWAQESAVIMNKDAAIGMEMVNLLGSAGMAVVGASTAHTGIGMVILGKAAGDALVSGINIARIAMGKEVMSQAGVIGGVTELGAWMLGYDKATRRRLGRKAEFVDAAADLGLGIKVFTKVGALRRLSAGFGLSDAGFIRDAAIWSTGVRVAKLLPGFLRVPVVDDDSKSRTVSAR